MKHTCDACDSSDLDILYTLDRIPAFQNKLYPTREAALRAPAASVSLAHCRRCDLVFNAAFQNDLMDYDGDYQNAQDHSPSFRSYLNEIADLIHPTDRKIVEIGCGKGYFLGMLEERGADIIGFDPTYEGDHPRITKEYFSRDTARGLAVDTIVMRHTLEHIERPLDFLLGLKEFLPPQVEISIEIPRFEWIAEHEAFWDIFHEHCNYFTEAFFQGIFGGKVKIHRTFGDQYMLVQGQVGDITIPKNAAKKTHFSLVFDQKLQFFAQKVSSFAHNFLWGAGAKGIAFANILDPHLRHIGGVIDINPRKQHHFVPLSGHACISAGSVAWDALGNDACLWIMNGNYRDEILSNLPENRHFEIITLGDEHKESIKG